MAKRIDGKAIAAQIKQELKEQVQQLAKDNITVTLAVIQVGQDPASCVYVRKDVYKRQLLQCAEGCGISGSEREGCMGQLPRLKEQQIL